MEASLTNYDIKVLPLGVPDWVEVGVAGGGGTATGSTWHLGLASRRAASVKNGRM